ncbi:TonB family protein [bacterium]|nr:TonB family protein [bacterium]MBU1434162.1 TonB family protein [bacterium]MBU1504257.1 TonB family protein [bacterium]
MNTLTAFSASKNFKSNAKFQAFFASLSLHILLLGLALSFVHSELKTEKEETKTISISLADYAPAAFVKPAKEAIPQEKEIQKKEPSKQKVQTKTAQTKKMQTSQQIPLIQEKVLSAEAFTPLVSHEVATENSAAKPLFTPLESSPKSAEQSATLLQPSIGIDPTTLGLIRSMIQNSLIYPLMAKKLKLEGVVVVSFVLSAEGRVESANILQKSGVTSLDSKALETVLALSGSYPSLNKTAQLQIPIAFSLKKS